MPKETAGGYITKAFSLGAKDIKTITSVRVEEALTSDSAAVRRLIEDGRTYRALMAQAQADVVRKVAKQEAKKHR